MSEWEKAGGETRWSDVVVRDEVKKDSGPCGSVAVGYYSGHSSQLGRTH